jgi:flagellar hook-associated protein 3 FlgL
MSTPIQIGRVSMQMQGALLLSTLQNSQVNLQKAQQQISTGDKLNLGSDDPGATLNIQSLKRQIAVNDNYSSNLQFAAGFLAQADSSLGNLNDMITQAKSIASAQVGSGVTADERSAQAEVVNSLLARALTIGNQRYQGLAIFGGQNGVDNPFSSVGGGYKYTGTTGEQGIVTPTGSTLNYTINGDDAFGAVSSEVVGYKRLSQMVSAATQVSDLRGPNGETLSLGTLNISMGTTTVSVDLSQASTMADVTRTLNAGLTSMGSTAQVMAFTGCLRVVGDATQTVSFTNSSNKATATDLGIAGLAVPPGTMRSGQTLSSRITATTPLITLNNGTGIDQAGITISNGANSATIGLAGLSTVEDLLNAINESGTNVRAEINANGTGINLFNPLSGTELRIGENGGRTAEQLGIRSFNPTTKLADFNNDMGVTPIAGTLTGPKGTMVVTRTDGTQFNVTVDGVKTPAQLAAAINGATGNSTVTAALNATGNGITLTDTTAGSGNLTVAAGANYVSNGSELGIFKTGTSGALTGSDITLSTDDFRITRQDGTSFTVSLAGNPAISTVQDVLDRINNADGNTDPATKVTAALNATGNGISLTDASSGAGTLAVTALNASAAAAQLGIAKTATTPGIINGDDTNPLVPTGVFSSLTLLRDSLLKNDTAGIARAAALLEKDGTRAIKARGIAGAKAKDVSSRKDDVTEEQTQLKSALSLLADTDFTETATKFQQIQTAYQASLQVAQTTRNLSLLDFLK